MSEFGGRAEPPAVGKQAHRGARQPQLACPAVKAVEHIVEALRRRQPRLQLQQALEQAFISALDDDLNTAQALGHVFSMTRIVNRLLDDKALRASEGTREILNSYRGRLGRVAGITGLFGEVPETFLQKLRARRCENLHIDPKKVEELLAQRLEARRNKDFQRSDEIRTQIAALGVEVRDTPEGQVWDLA